MPLLKRSKEKEQIPPKYRIQTLAIRLFHWSFVLSVTALLLSGFYIHNPSAINGIWDMAKNKFVHSSFAIILTFLVLGRFYYSLITGDRKNFSLGWRDLLSLPGFLKYYLYLTDLPPAPLPKYNVGQKITYLSWLLAFLILAVTGYAMLFPASLQPLVRLLGGVQRIRVAHYLMAVWFVFTVPIHIYLVFTEDPAKLQAMFTGVVRKKISSGKHKKQL